MELTMCYHENGGNESFEIRGGNARTESAERSRDESQLHGVSSFRWFNGSKADIGWTEGVRCTLAVSDGHIPAVIGGV